MNPQDFENKLKKALHRRTVVHPNDEQRRPAAVLIPLYFQDGGYNILFTRRTQLVHHHKGDISFPGGAMSPEDDNSLLVTALRESFEEVGLADRDVRVLGELDDMLTRGSPFIISPFVGSIPADYRFVVSNYEIEELIRVPVEALLKPGCRRDETEIWMDSRSIPSYVYTFQDKLIVGATARILKQFLEIYQKLKDEAGPTPSS
jgi:8-oxo-dGTP pyrophosphatase MutT (NUDIX family)